MEADLGKKMQIPRQFVTLSGYDAMMFDNSARVTLW